MEVPQNTQTRLVVASSGTSFQEFLDYQRELFYSQVDQFQSLVVVQRKLSGANPLSKEMAVGTLSMITGKRSRDQLNPKAVRYMQAVFSIKDSVNRKEAHEISSLFGITTAQVRNFFTSQRSRVRGYLQTLKEEARVPEAPPESVCGENSNHRLLPCAETVSPLKTAEPLGTDEVRMVPALGDADDHERHFTRNIFRLMRKEETFSGRVKLMEWILGVQSPPILQWFLSRGGILIIATWLSEATLEEQTTFLVIILKVLCHVPLHRALPVHMSAILQNLNRLRFYKTPEISNRARLLLFRWSKVFSQTQVFKIPKPGPSPSSSSRDAEPPKIQEPKLLPPPQRKHHHHPPIGQCGERRRVQLLEHDPVEKVPTSSSQSRPLSADDIRKAKMRAQWTRNKEATTQKPPPPPPFSESRKAPRDSPPSHAMSSSSAPPLNVTWRTPPEMKSQDAWKVMAGEGSKEREIQRNRTRRERELVYVSPREDIPPHPQEPWDVELDYDDTLTPEIPSDPLSEPAHHPTPPSQPSVSLNGQEADLELLAVLLKNPQLVFALTSEGGISSQERVRLLDTIKAGASASVELPPLSPTPWPPPLPPFDNGDFLPPSHNRVRRRTSHASGFNRHH